MVRLSSLVYGSTVADNIVGRFLLGILTDISRWFQDEQLFLQENRTKSSGNTVFLPGLQLRWTPIPKPVISVGEHQDGLNPSTLM